MIIINSTMFNELKNKKLIKFSKYNKNFTVINKNKKSRRKKYAVVESKDIMKAILDSKS